MIWKGLCPARMLDDDYNDDDVQWRRKKKNWRRRRVLDVQSILVNRYGFLNISKDEGSSRRVGWDGI